MLKEIALFLAAAVIAVPLFKRFGLGAVLGYLFAGMLIGPSGLGLIDDVDRILHASEFGVVLLMFIIGLELEPSRLWLFRHQVFGLGGAQVLLTTAALSGIGLLVGLPRDAALVAGFALAMSSTAFVLQMLAERKELTDRHGRSAFAILLFQDIAVVPGLALLPFLAAPVAGHEAEGGLNGALKAVAVLVLVVLGGRYLLRPVFRRIASVEMPELFTATGLLIVTGTALALDAVGLSMSLGAFLAGVLLADSEYRHELQADIEPFKGLLLGLFFIAVGMSAELRLLREAPLAILAAVVVLIAVKAAILYGLGRIARLPPESSRSLAFAMPQGGEFAFVLLGVAATAGIVDDELRDLLIVIVTASMIATPPLYMLAARLRNRDDAPAYDVVDVPEHQVILAGFGPFGQIVGRLLRLKNIPYTVLERDAKQVDFVRQFGNTIFYSDAGRVEVLRAAKADKARFLVLAISDVEQSLRVAATVRRHFPHLKIFASARHRSHAMQLMDLGVSHVVRRAYASSLELTGELLRAFGESDEQVAHDLAQFRRVDEEMLRKQQAIHRDQTALISSARALAKELEDLFEADAAADKPKR